MSYPPRTGRFGSPLVLSRVHWVRPELVVEVTYLTWTLENLLRQVVYVGLLADKPARDVRRPVPYRKTAAPPPPSRRAVLAAHRVAVPRANILQLLPDAVVPSRDELARYLKTVAPEALKHLARRPLKPLRHIHGTTFYHRGKLPPAVLTLQKREGGEGVCVRVDDLDRLLGLLDMDVVEIQPWGATVDDIEHPDVLIFDLDPGEDVLDAFTNVSGFPSPIRMRWTTSCFLPVRHISAV